ncbi:MAG: 6-bladed beta-propeller [Candidatus Aminicenantes bacterium]|nr:6-bladed beta-propeller [Candidatus Aminicenantes bacterium]
MKLSMRFELVILLALCLALSSACSKGTRNKGWSVNIEIVDGIKVITNPEEPKFGVFEFELEEDLAIGDANDEDYFFMRRLTLSVDNEGNLFVCDGGSKRVTKYDKNGIYVGVIGRQGQGPGEYMSPSRVFLDDFGNSCVHDFRSLLFFDKDGVFQKKIPLKGMYNLFPGPHGTFLYSTQPSGFAEGGAKTSIMQISETGEPVRTIAEYPVSYNKSFKSTVLHWYTNWAAFTPRTFDSFYYGFSRDYMINVADSDGSTIFIFAKEENPQPISVEEKKLTMKDGIMLVSGTKDVERATVFPEHRPFFRSFFSDDTGHLYVILFKSIFEREEQNLAVDVFSKEGIYLYRMNWSFIPALIKESFLYEVREDEDTGDVKVIRHKITNWNKFKEEQAYKN